MNLHILKQELIKNNVSEDAYSIMSEGRGECYVISREGSQWLTYYSERGEKQNLMHFNHEEDACTYFLKSILSDTTSRNKY